MSYGHAQFAQGTPQNPAYAAQLAQQQQQLLQQQQQGGFRSSAQQLAQAQAQAQAQAFRAQAQASGTPSTNPLAGYPQSVQQGGRGAVVQQAQNAQGEHVPIGDGNDGLRSAKRRKPTDRSLPSFLPSTSSPTEGPTVARLADSTTSLQSLSKSYAQLQQVERKLDWNVSRRKVELTETLNANRPPGIKRTLRLHLVAKLLDQPWQLPLADLTAPPASDAPATLRHNGTAGLDGDISVGGDIDISAPGEIVLDPLLPPAPAPVPKPEPPPVGAPDFEKGTGIPRFELSISGEIMGEPEIPGGNFTSFMHRIVVETDRDPTQYDQTGPINWTRSLATANLPGLSLSLPTSTKTQVRLSLYLDQAADVFGLAPDLANLLDMHEGDRTSILQALWGYIKLYGLQDDDKKHIRPDARMKKIFAGQEKVPFHHLPEYVNRFLTPPPPVVIEYSIPVDKDSENTHTAFDIQISVVDPVRGEMERASKVLNAPTDRTTEIATLDEKLSLDATAIKSSLLKRTFLTAFASSPHTFITSWLSSQSRDLNLILGNDKGSQSTVGGGPSWREEVRRAEVWRGEWVKEGANVYGSRKMEGAIKQAVGRNVGMMQQQQQQQHMQMQQQQMMGQQQMQLQMQQGRR